MNYLSRSELGFSLLKGFFPGGGVGPLPLNIGKINSWPLLMCWQLYSVLRVQNVIWSVGGVHNGRCTNIHRMGIYAWRSIWRWELNILSEWLITCAYDKAIRKINFFSPIRADTILGWRAKVYCVHPRTRPL